MPNKRFFSLAIGPICAAVAGMLLGLARADEPAPKDDPAVSAARKRQTAAKTVFVEFQQKEIKFKGSASDEGGPAAGAKVPVPATDLTLESTNRLVLDGKKIRYENNHPYWSNLYVADGKPQKRTNIDVFDGVGWTTYLPYGLNGSGQTPLVQIHVPGSPTSGAAGPLMAAFRGLNAGFTPWLLSAMKRTGADPLAIDGAACQEYVVETSPTHKFYLDPAQDYLIRQVKIVRQNHVTEQLDINYRRDRVLGLVPDSWLNTQHSPTGALQHTVAVKVLQVQLNEPQPAELFDLHFPPGTEVIDFRLDNKTYRVQPDGTLAEARQSGGEDSSQTVPPQAEPWYENQYFLFAVGVAAAAGVVLAYYMWKKRTSAPEVCG